MNEKDQELDQELGQELEEDGLVTLTLDDGSELECVILTIFPAGGKDYIALLPTEGADAEDGVVYLYRFAADEETGELDLGNIEDDEEYDMVSDAFDEWLDAGEYDEIVEEDAFEFEEE